MLEIHTININELSIWNTLEYIKKNIYYNQKI